MLVPIEDMYPNGYTESKKWQDMPGLSLVAETSGPISYLTCRFFLTLTPTRIAYIQLLVDGMSYGKQTMLTSDGGYMDIDLSRALHSLSTAQHEFKFQWRTTGGRAALHQKIYISLRTGYY